MVTKLLRFVTENRVRGKSNASGIKAPCGATTCATVVRIHRVSKMPKIVAAAALSSVREGHITLGVRAINYHRNTVQQEIDETPFRIVPIFIAQCLADW
jgi:hypothetical protein